MSRTPDQKLYTSIQNMLDEQEPQFADEFRRYQKRWSVRLRKWLLLLGVRLRVGWHRLWIRHNEFHRSLDLDCDALEKMNATQRNNYLESLAKRRSLAHIRDLEREDKKRSK